jgi:hypothetical protein|tara:strand:+ start:232 stop:648 length:417 start_codon:yes stop_codon:yes gene_type:complete
MKLLIYSGKEKFVSSGASEDTVVVEGVSLENTVANSYNKVEAFDFIEAAAYEDPIGMLLSRLRKGGVLSMQGIDTTKAATLFLQGQINAGAFSDLVVSRNVRATKLNDIIQYVESKNGYEVQFAGISGLHYIVEVNRK